MHPRCPRLRCPQPILLTRRASFLKHSSDYAISLLKMQCLHFHQCKGQPSHKAQDCETPVSPVPASLPLKAPCFRITIMIHSDIPNYLHFPNVAPGSSPLCACTHTIPSPGRRSSPPFSANYCQSPCKCHLLLEALQDASSKNRPIPSVSCVCPNRGTSQSLQHSDLFPVSRATW